MEDNSRSYRFDMQNLSQSLGSLNNYVNGLKQVMRDPSNDFLAPTKISPKHSRAFRKQHSFDLTGLLLSTAVVLTQVGIFYFTFGDWFRKCKAFVNYNRNGRKEQFSDTVGRRPKRKRHASHKSVVEEWSSEEQSASSGDEDTQKPRKKLLTKSQQ
jgi:hypothetical protein